MKSLFIILFLALISTYTFATDYVVYGNITPEEAKGLYIDASTKYKFPTFINDDGKTTWFLQFDGKSHWNIHDGFSSAYFWTSSTASTPPIGATWTPESGATGNPEIVDAGSIVPISMWSIFALFVLIGMFVLFRKNIFKKAQEI